MIIVAAQRAGAAILWSEDLAERHVVRREAEFGGFAHAFQDRHGFSRRDRHRDHAGV